MRSTISEAICSDRALSPPVDEADRLMAIVLGRSADSVATDWQLRSGGTGRDTLLLTISDFTGSVSTAFSPDELSRPCHLYSRLHKLWGELLQVRSRTVVDRLQSVTVTADAVGDHA